MSGLDPRAEASTTPQTFNPVCPLTFTVITRGTAMFRDAFGWYNATGERPSNDDLHVMLDCHATEGDQAVLDIWSHADYRGGEVGFFLVTPESLGAPSTCAGGDCCATVERAAAGQGQIFYSESSFNPDYIGAESLIHLLVYDSRVWEHQFYFAWEDIYGGSNNDFTDLVTSVSGVECSGGGVACDTGEEGVCEYGVTRCEGEDLLCTQLYEAESERCDGLDNDCDGTIDDAAVCPEDGEVCHNGRCVPHCSLSDEFACYEDWGYFCDPETGFCVETACVDVPCPSDQVCQGGHCVGGCDGVVCPHGRSCRLGSCIDPCLGVSCPTGQLCREGVCLNGCGQCNGLICENPLVCETSSGECRDPSCTTACPAGQHCEAALCVDDCQGAVCPGGQECADGECRFPEDGPADADADVDADADGDSDGDGGTEEDADGPVTYHAESACSCRASGASNAWIGSPLLHALVGTLTSLR